MKIISLNVIAEIYLQFKTLHSTVYTFTVAYKKVYLARKEKDLEPFNLFCKCIISNNIKHTNISTYSFAQEILELIILHFPIPAMTAQAK